MLIDLLTDGCQHASVRFSDVHECARVYVCLLACASNLYMETIREIFAEVAYKLNHLVLGAITSIEN
jgi:hypothetical protein